jgi:glycosyltransferase involved in cell wall biosynthesis
VVGAFGVNKRTKQHDLLIYAAAYLKKWGEDEDIVFYLHTEAHAPILQGYPLPWLVKWANIDGEYYDVSDMFMWKPDTYDKRGGKYEGAAFDHDTLGQAGVLTMPDTPQERGFLFGQYDIVSRYNCLDLYCDVSSVEGWGLPPCEAMLCGVPTTSVNDGLIRSEIHSEGAYMLDPVYEYETWHRGAKLAKLHPMDIAHAILDFKEDSDMRRDYAERGMAAMQKYTWEPTRKVMVDAVRAAVGM